MYDVQGQNDYYGNNQSNYGAANTNQFMNNMPNNGAYEDEDMLLGGEADGELNYDQNQMQQLD